LADSFRNAYVAFPAVAMNLQECSRIKARRDIYEAAVGFLTPGTKIGFTRNPCFASHNYIS
jgi:hypothetical protein